MPSAATGSRLFTLFPRNMLIFICSPKLHRIRSPYEICKGIFSGYCFSSKVRKIETEDQGKVRIDNVSLVQ